MPSQCRHVRANGTQCRAHRVWKEDYCFFHLHHRTPNGMPKRSEEPPPQLPKSGIEIPLLEDLASIQIAIGRILTALAQGKISDADARTYLYGLRLAASNVRHKDFAPTHSVETYIQYDNGDTVGPEQFFDEKKPEHPLMNSGLLALRHLADRLDYEAALDAYFTRGEEPPSTMRPPVAGPPTPSDANKSEIQNWIKTGWKACHTRTKAIELARQFIDNPDLTNKKDRPSAPIPPETAFSIRPPTQRTA